jgi:hypothetical protein
MKLILFLLLTFSFQALAQNDDCIFDLSTQTDAFVRDIEGVKITPGTMRKRKPPYC